MKTLLAVVVIAALVVASAFAGSREHNSKGQGQAKRQTVMEQQQYMHWLQQGCPPLIAPRQPSQPVQSPPSTTKPAGKESGTR
jgi:hypothetical protein